MSTPLGAHELIYDWNLLDLELGARLRPHVYDQTAAMLPIEALGAYVRGLGEGVHTLWLGAVTHDTEAALAAQRARLLQEHGWVGPERGLSVHVDVYALAQRPQLARTLVGCSVRHVGLELPASRLYQALAPGGWRCLDSEPSQPTEPSQGAPPSQACELSVPIAHGSVHGRDAEPSLREWLRQAVVAAEPIIEEGAGLCLVLCDVARAVPHDLALLVRAACGCGITRICLSDDSGAAQASGVASLLGFVRRCAAAEGMDVELEWRGSNERDLAVANALEAVAGGVVAVHASMVGLGMQSGWLSLEQLLVNLRLDACTDDDISWLAAAVDQVAAAVGQPVPVNYPIFGHDAFRTATGVHAAAIVKAQLKGDTWLEDSVYSGVPASLIGRRQLIDVGPMSGESNVVAWLRQRNLEVTPARVSLILERAKSSKHTLTEAEIVAVVEPLAHT
jgi:HMGL-like